MLKLFWLVICMSVLYLHSFPTRHSPKPGIPLFVECRYVELVLIQITTSQHSIHRLYNHLDLKWVNLGDCFFFVNNCMFVRLSLFVCVHTHTHTEYLTLSCRWILCGVVLEGIWRIALLPTFRGGSYLLVSNCKIKNHLKSLRWFNMRNHFHSVLFLLTAKPKAERDDN